MPVEQVRLTGDTSGEALVDRLTEIIAGGGIVRQAIPYPDGVVLVWSQPERETRDFHTPIR